MPESTPAYVLSASAAPQYRRGWVALFLFTLTMINYIDRISLSFAARPIAAEFHLSSVTLGYLFSSFLWTYTACLIPAGVLVDRWGCRQRPRGSPHSSSRNHGRTLRLITASTLCR